MPAKKILLVEDNEVNMRLLRMTLMDPGYTFIESTNGDDAIASVITEKPDLIVLDIQIPKKDGYEVTKILKSREDTKDIPILALTAYAMVGDKEKILKAGCNQYVSKPFSPQELQEIVEKLLEDRK